MLPLPEAARTELQYTRKQELNLRPHVREQGLDDLSQHLLPLRVYTNSKLDMGAEGRPSTMACGHLTHWGKCLSQKLQED